MIRLIIIILLLIFNFHNNSAIKTTNVQFIPDCPSHTTENITHGKLRLRDDILLVETVLELFQPIKDENAKFPTHIFTKWKLIPIKTFGILNSSEVLDNKPLDIQISYDEKKSFKNSNQTWTQILNISYSYDILTIYPISKIDILKSTFNKIKKSTSIKFYMMDSHILQATENNDWYRIFQGCSTELNAKLKSNYLSTIIVLPNVLTSPTYSLCDSENCKLNDHSFDVANFTSILIMMALKSNDQRIWSIEPPYLEKDYNSEEQNVEVSPNIDNESSNSVRLSFLIVIGLIIIFVIVGFGYYYIKNTTNSCTWYFQR